MKNLKAKEIFFGQYIGQDVFCDNSYMVEDGSFWELYSSVINFQNSFIKLKSIEKLEEIEFLTMIKILDKNFNDNIDELKEELGSEFEEFYSQFTEPFTNKDYDVVYNKISPVKIGHIFDYLRTRGYAVPYLGLSVDDLVKLGYIVLI